MQGWIEERSDYRGEYMGKEREEVCVRACDSVRVFERVV